MSITQDIRDAFQRRDNALTQLLLINGLVFAALAILYALAFLTQGGSWFSLVMRQLELSTYLPTVVRHPWTVLTYAFTHLNPFHILFNLLNLYYFGQLVREYLGNRRLVSLYVLGGLAGAAVVLLAYNLLPALQPAAAATSVIGASAAVIAVVVGAATLLPDYTFMLFIIGPVKIKWIAIALVLISIATVSNNTAGEISHLGGALLGFVYIRQLNAGRDLGRPVQAVGGWLSTLFSRRPAMQVSHRTAAPAARPAAAKTGAAPTEDVDAILDKISRSGYESLSKDEKQRLFRASQQ